MATGTKMPACLVVCSVLLLFYPLFTTAQDLDQENQLFDVGPPVFNLAQGRNITASATCGVGVTDPELYCRLTGITGVGDSTSFEVIQGQLCDYCDPSDPSKSHPPENAIDGTEKWWQSPPLSRLGLELNKVNVTISLGQEFHVAYVFIKMANSPRPGVWVLERSTDYGETWQPWQYFADTPSDCYNFFDTQADLPLTADTQVLCSTGFSQVVPLTDGEIVVSLVNGRPNAKNFSYAMDLQEWTKATDIQLRLLRTKTLHAHLMEVARQDPTTFRRYYYSIKDISIGGQCVCNGHALACGVRSPNTQKLVCRCMSNTCGEQCERCCPGFVQKRWQRAAANKDFKCERCNCHGHSDECVFDEDVELQRLSLDIHGNYEGGGVCQNCRDNTEGINCEKCSFGYYRPYNVLRNATDACRPCQCDLRVSTGECEEGSGRCLCRKEYTGLDCDRCSVGYYNYPTCIPCACDANGTEAALCVPVSGDCPCKPNYDGQKCDQCAAGYYNFPECIPCDCNRVGSPGTVCERESGQCSCSANYGGRDCGECAHGYYQYPTCQYCDCDHAGTEEEVCNKVDGQCMCKANYTGSRCDRCEPGFFGFPDCVKCDCVMPGSRSAVCNPQGQCSCLPEFDGRSCDRCKAGFYNYPQCSPCRCDLYGSAGKSCDQVTGQCSCYSNFDGLKCDSCKENFYNYPNCEICNCNPDGAKELPGYPLGGCGIVTIGRLCECKERVRGRICDQCEPGYWNLNRWNEEGCEECGCYKPGTLLDANRCDQETGQCMCKPYVDGRNCNICKQGFFNLQESNAFGCEGCKCNIGGSQSRACDQETGKCKCKDRVQGQRCDQPQEGYFAPDLHQYKFELEDGYTPDRANVRYGYDPLVFPDFSWRGYAILTPVQPEVLMDFEIRTPSLYQVIFRYTNRENTTAKGTVNLTPRSPTDSAQQGEILFPPSADPNFSKVISAGISTYVLNPGAWTISTKVPHNIFLDYFILIPQSFYEASQLQEKVTDPCEAFGDPGPCIDFKYPDLDEFSGAFDVLGIQDLRNLPKDLESVEFELAVPEPDLYIIVVNFFNPENTSQPLNVDVMVEGVSTPAVVTLPSCPYSTYCRQVLIGESGLEGIFNISSSPAKLVFTPRNENDTIKVYLDSVYAIPLDKWTPEYSRLRIVCIKVNGVCVASSYGLPVGSVTIQYEVGENQILRAVVIPTNILDPSIGLVNLNDSREDVEHTTCPISDNEEEPECTTEIVSQPVQLELRGQISKPGDYILVVHYYMPTLTGLDIPITVHTEGQAVAGMFHPRFCPSVVGCRTPLIYDQTGANVVKLTGMDVRVLFNATDGDNIWLDYLLIIPREHYSNDYLDIQPVDNSQLFITNCIDEGFQLNTTDPFCLAGAFTLTTDLNNGGMDCNCNFLGSTDLICDGFGGSCSCKPNVVGRTCSACAQDYYGFPDCKPCNCPFGLCDVDTGACICAPNVEGEKCDRCVSGAYGYDPLIGCQFCECNLFGTVNGNASCDQLTGQCDCKSSIGGRKCDACLAGFYGFPYCRDCGCDTRGTEDDICDKSTGRCFCKANVQGRYCDECADGMFSLTDENPKGCIECFCFGHTRSCENSGLSWDQISDMKDWNIFSLGTDIVNITMDNMDDELVATSGEGVLDDLFWMAPPSYRGKKLNAYGGKLEYTVLFTLPEDGDSIGLVKEDVLLTGSNFTMFHSHDAQPAPNTPFKFELELREYNFKHESNKAVSREQFMMLLNSIDSLVIRASYYSRMAEIRLKEVTMQVASEQGQGMLAESVELCECPSNYMGMSCEKCAPGHFRPQNSPVGACFQCDCNGHADECDLNTGVCYNCRDNTTGPNCEQCLPGYHGDPRYGACSICSCPLPIPTNNFATTCSATQDGYTNYCVCQAGYTGRLCDSCAPGYYGNPLEVGSSCQPCSCSGNIDLRNPRSCDRFTGACLLCENNSGGLYCDQCRDWYWGDAVLAKDCKPCTCDRCGSERCDNIQGVCECKPNVIGQDCDRCAPNTWGFRFCQGCQDCACGVGAVSAQCDLDTGICECQPGVEGEKCDQCMAGHWNLGPAGCQVCDCDADGTMGCDPETGRCQCIRGVGGDRCDRCKPKYVLVANRGCQECDYCVHLLIDDLDAMASSVSVVSRTLADVSVGVGAFNRLSFYNETVDMLRPAVDDLFNLDVEKLNNTLNEIGEGLDNLTAVARKLQDKSTAVAFEADELPKNVKSLLANVSESQDLIREVTVLVQDVVRYVEDVYQGLLTSGTARNIDQFITDGERIVEELKMVDFDAQNASAQAHLMTAEDFLMKIENLKLETMSGVNRTEQIKADIADLDNRLRDLLNSSRYAEVDTNQALSILKRLRAVQLESLLRSIEKLNDLAQERLQTIDTATEALEEAEKLLDEADSNVKDIESEFSRLTTAIPTLTNHVDTLAMSMDDLTDLANQSQIHAAELAAQAAELESVYESTRNRSEDPVKAGQAYQNIESAIEEAKASADQALQDAETAKMESDGIHDNVTEALADSEALIEQARQLLDNSTNLLSQELQEAVQGVQMGQEEHEAVRKEFDPLLEKFDELNATSAKIQNKSTEVLSKVNSTFGTLAETERLSQSIIDQTKGMNAKNNFIVTNTPKINDDMRQTQDNLDSVNQNLPEVKSMVEYLSEVADRVAEQSKLLGRNVTALKEKIAQARDEANRIKVGLDLLGNTTVTLRNPTTLKDTGSYSTVSLYLQTLENEGLLMYIGDNQNTGTAPADNRAKRSVDSMYSVIEEIMENEEATAPMLRMRRQATAVETDFLGLELNQGRVVFTANLGSGAARIISNRAVNDGKWHQIVAERIGKTCTLTVKSDGEDDDVVDGTTQGAFVVLELNPVTTNILVGGKPTDFKLPGDLSERFFKGAIEDIIFDGKTLGLWNFVDSENNFQGAYERDFMKDIFLEGVNFNGAGYAVLSRDEYRLQPDRTKVTFTFKTYAEDGLLFYMGRDDYFAVELRMGKVLLRYDLGGGPAVMQSAASYNNGEWHTISIDRNNREATMNIDERTEELQMTAPGQMNNLETTDDMYIGGMDNVLSAHRSVMTVGFDGCIKDMIIGSLSADIFDNKRAKGVEKGCPTKIIHIASFPSTGSSYIGLAPVNIGSEFDLTFKVRTKQNNSLLMLATDASQSNIFSVYMQEGMIVIGEQLGTETSKVSGKINTYGDGEWHYIAIMKKSQRLTLNIDDREMLDEEQSVSGDLLTDTPLYFGGFPSNLKISSEAVPVTTGIAGCMGDITINQIFQNLAILEEKQSVTLDECELEIKELVTATEPPPTGPTLPPGECALPMKRSNFEDDAYFNRDGTRYGSSLYSRREYKALPVKLLFKPVTIAIKFKTTVENGVLLYTADTKHTDFLGVFMTDGHINFGFNCGTGSALMTSPEKYNDGQWHTVTVTRNKKYGILEVDGEKVSDGKSKGSTQSLNNKPPIYIGGISPEAKEKAVKNLGAGYNSFMGCIDTVLTNNLPLQPEKLTLEVEAQTCNDGLEFGTFIGVTGGFIEMMDEFMVGKNLDISLEVRPRRIEGVLMSVHGEGDYLILQISEGSVVFTIDNGAGPITVRTTPQIENAICDGKWHSIQASKKGNALELTVDGVTVSETEAGNPINTVANTKDTLYIAGVSSPEAKGLLATMGYMGCIRNVKVKDEVLNLAEGTILGDVRIDACPQD